MKPVVSPGVFPGNTVCFAVADSVGNMVSSFNSLLHRFGSGIAVDNTGSTLQNRDHLFSCESTPSELPITREKGP